ncbi:MAG TPA: hypothetical protein VG477_18515, partial [Thermoanaerobaculia bacterium]|nr:hypothetical protein [Thermoanaerobaculia bacterium]
VDEVGGQLGLLRDRLGLEIQRVNFSEEEKNLTNLHILADHAFSLLLSWRSVRHYFDWTGNDVFLGPQLVLLSRALRVAAESVHETYTALDSVFVGPAERQVVLLRFKGDESPMTLADLLEWVDTFAATEGPRLIQEAGKDGVIAFRSTLTQLSGLVEEAVEITRRSSNNPTRGVHTLRVSTALEGVHVHLKTALELASPLSRTPEPVVDSVNPAMVRALAFVQIQIGGEDFEPGAKVELTLNEDEEKETVTAATVHFVSSTTLFATFKLTNATPGDWKVVVRNPDGQENTESKLIAIRGALLSAAAPQIKCLNPLEVTAGEKVEMEIVGSGFLEEAVVTILGGDIEIQPGLKLEGDDLLLLTFDVDLEAEPGLRTLIVTNPDNQEALATFKVLGADQEEDEEEDDDEEEDEENEDEESA